MTGGPRLAECLRGDGGQSRARIRQWLGATEPDEAPTSTDAGNAIRFARRHGAGTLLPRVAELAPLDGDALAADAGAGIMRLAKETARAIYREATLAPGEDAAAARRVGGAIRERARPPPDARPRAERALP